MSMNEKHRGHVPVTSLSLENMVSIIHKRNEITHEASETAANHRSAGHVSPTNKSKATRAREKYGKEEASEGVPKEEK